MSAEVIAFPDPVVVFKARYDALNAQIDQDPEEADAISMRVVAIEDKIFASVPRSPAGAIAMIVVLRASECRNTRPRSDGSRSRPAPSPAMRR